ncbi:MAG: hypothetical protein GWP37_03490, partial [Gammaproteobacteria bacterium]|nr:hypothetical protein [Gammaproteobacteria bacterium]
IIDIDALYQRRWIFEQSVMAQLSDTRKTHPGSPLIKADRAIVFLFGILRDLTGSVLRNSMIGRVPFQQLSATLTLRMPSAKGIAGIPDAIAYVYATEPGNHRTEVWRLRIGYEAKHAAHGREPAPRLVEQPQKEDNSYALNFAAMNGYLTSASVHGTNTLVKPSFTSYGQDSEAYKDIENLAPMDLFDPVFLRAHVPDAFTLPNITSALRSRKPPPIRDDIHEAEWAAWPGASHANNFMVLADFTRAPRDNDSDESSDHRKPGKSRWSKQQKHQAQGRYADALPWWVGGPLLSGMCGVSQGLIELLNPEEDQHRCTAVNAVRFLSRPVCFYASTVTPHHSLPVTPGPDIESSPTTRELSVSDTPCPVSVRVSSSSYTTSLRLQGGGPSSGITPQIMVLGVKKFDTKPNLSHFHILGSPRGDPAQLVVNLVSVSHLMTLMRTQNLFKGSIKLATVEDPCWSILTSHERAHLASDTIVTFASQPRAKQWLAGRLQSEYACVLLFADNFPKTFISMSSVANYPVMCQGMDAQVRTLPPELQMAFIDIPRFTDVSSHAVRAVVRSYVDNSIATLPSTLDAADLSRIITHPVLRTAYQLVANGQTPVMPCEVLMPPLLHAFFDTSTPVWISWVETHVMLTTACPPGDRKCEVIGVHEAGWVVALLSLELEVDDYLTMLREQALASTGRRGRRGWLCTIAEKSGVYHATAAFLTGTLRIHSKTVLRLLHKPPVITFGHVSRSADIADCIPQFQPMGSLANLGPVQPTDILQLPGVLHRLRPPFAKWAEYAREITPDRERAQAIVSRLSREVVASSIFAGWYSDYCNENRRMRGQAIIRKLAATRALDSTFDNWLRAVTAVAPAPSVATNAVTEVAVTTAAAAADPSHEPAHDHPTLPVVSLPALEGQADTTTAAPASDAVSVMHMLDAPMGARSSPMIRRVEVWFLYAGEAGVETYFAKDATVQPPRHCFSSNLGGDDDGRKSMVDQLTLASIPQSWIQQLLDVPLEDMRWIDTSNDESVEPYCAFSVSSGHHQVALWPVLLPKRGDDLDGCYGQWRSLSSVIHMYHVQGSLHDGKLSNAVANTLAKIIDDTIGMTLPRMAGWDDRHVLSRTSSRMLPPATSLSDTTHLTPVMQSLQHWGKNLSESLLEKSTASLHAALENSATSLRQGQSSHNSAILTEFEKLRESMKQSSADSQQALQAQSTQSSAMLKEFVDRFSLANEQRTRAEDQSRADMLKEFSDHLATVSANQSAAAERARGDMITLATGMKERNDRLISELLEHRESIKPAGIPPTGVAGELLQASVSALQASVQTSSEQTITSFEQASQRTSAALSAMADAIKASSEQSIALSASLHESHTKTFGLVTESIKESNNQLVTQLKGSLEGLQSSIASSITAANSQLIGHLEEKIQSARPAEDIGKLAMESMVIAVQKSSAATIEGVNTVMSTFEGAGNKREAALDKTVASMSGALESAIKSLKDNMEVRELAQQAQLRNHEAAMQKMFSAFGTDVAKGIKDLSQHITQTCSQSPDASDSNVFTPPPPRQATFIRRPGNTLVDDAAAKCAEPHSAKVTSKQEDKSGDDLSKPSKDKDDGQQRDGEGKGLFNDGSDEKRDSDYQADADGLRFATRQPNSSSVTNRLYVFLIQDRVLSGQQESVPHVLTVAPYAFEGCATLLQPLQTVHPIPDTTYHYSEVYDLLNTAIPSEHLNEESCRTLLGDRSRAHIQSSLLSRLAA